MTGEIGSPIVPARGETEDRRIKVRRGVRIRHSEHVVVLKNRRHGSTNPVTRNHNRG